MEIYSSESSRTPRPGFDWQSIRTTRRASPNFLVGERHGKSRRRARVDVRQPVRVRRDPAVVIVDVPHESAPHGGRLAVLRDARDANDGFDTEANARSAAVSSTRDARARRGRTSGATRVVRRASLRRTRADAVGMGETVRRDMSREAASDVGTRNGALYVLHGRRARLGGAVAPGIIVELVVELVVALDVRDLVIDGLFYLRRQLTPSSAERFVVGVGEMKV